MIPKVVVLGATGATGRHVVTKSLASGYDTIAYVRTPAKIKLRHEQLTVMQGTLSDTENLREVFADADAVISTLGFVADAKVKPSDYLPGILTVMVAQRVQRYIGISSGAAVTLAGDEKPLFAKIMGALLAAFQPEAVADKRNEYKILSNQQDITWTLARPTRLLNTAGTSRYAPDLHKPQRLWVSREDVADFLVTQVESSQWLNQAPFVA